jgi:hypothetical protein
MQLLHKAGFFFWWNGKGACAGDPRDPGTKFSDQFLDETMWFGACSVGIYHAEIIENFVPGSPGCRWWFTPRKIHARVWPKTLYCHLLLACMAGKREAIFVFSRITMAESALRWFLIVMRKMKTLRVRVASLQLKLSRRGHGSSTRHHAPGWSG